MFCLCGSQSGYPHTWDCPFPYYGSNQDRVNKWIVASFYLKWYCSGSCKMTTCWKYKFQQLFIGV
jgi:hypothetical protein